MCFDFVGQKHLGHTFEMNERFGSVSHNFSLELCGGEVVGEHISNWRQPGGCKSKSCSLSWRLVQSETIVRIPGARIGEDHLVTRFQPIYDFNRVDGAAS